MARAWTCGLLPILSVTVLFAAPPTAASAQDVLETQVAAFEAQLGSEYERVPSAEQRGNLKAGGQDLLTFTLQAGGDYAFVGVCDDDCSDLDLALADASGNVVATDTEADAFPIVGIESAGADQYSLQVAMIGCSIAPCAYMVTAYRRTEPAAGGATRAAEVEIAPGTARLRETGRLEAGDSRLNGGEFFDQHDVQMTAGETITATLNSDDFDSYLILISPSGKQTDNDDGEEGHPGSLIQMLAEESGTWILKATSYQPEETGSYRLEVTAGDPSAAPVAAGAPEGVRSETGTLSPGDEELEAGEYIDFYTFSGTQGERALIDLRSNEVDPYLILISPSDEPFENDDFEGDPHRSVIALDLEETGEYRIGVTTFGPGQTGDYELRISHGSGSADRGTLRERGRLETGDETLRSGEFADAYDVHGEPGQELIATVSSSEFDTYLMVLGPESDRQENDDVEGRPGESEVRMTLSESGQYQVVVTSYQPGDAGTYDLRVEQHDQERASQQRRDVHNLPIGSSVRGSLEEGDGLLDSGEFRDLYVFDGTAGQVVSLTMTSEGFDTYLGLISPAGEAIENDDYEGDTRASRIDQRLTETGRYRIMATSYESGQTGSYELKVDGATSAALAPSATGSDGPSRVYGVFVGISDYGGRANDLAYTAEDAHRVAGALQAGAGMRSADAVILTDGQATRANVERAVREVGAKAGPDDMFVFFYSGHGSRVDRPSPQASDPDAIDETIELFDSGITDDEFSQLLNEINPGISMLVLDACFSGGFSKDVVSVPGRIGFFSSEEDVTSSVAAKFRAGGFLAQFIADAIGERLADANGDRALSAIELSQYLYERYRADVKSGGPDDYVRTGGPQTGYQHLIVDRGSIGASQILFRR